MKTGYFKRILLFVGTNLAVILVLSVVLRLLGVDRMLAERGGLGYEGLLIFSAIFGFAGALFSLATSKYMAKMFTGAKVITSPRNESEAWLLATVQRLSRQAGIGMPEVAVYDSPEMNAFATGARRNAALVAVSTGLLRSMRADEVEAVLAHEVSHVANGDMVTLTLLQGVVNTFVIFLSRVVGDLVDRTVFRSERGYGPGYFITVIVAQILLGVLATIIVMWFSRRREFRADAGSAQLVGPGPMVSALQRLGGARGPTVLPDAFQSFGIRGAKSGFGRLFLSHPPIEERIEALQRGS